MDAVHHLPVLAEHPGRSCGAEGVTTAAPGRGLRLSHHAMAPGRATIAGRAPKTIDSASALSGATPEVAKSATMPASRTPQPPTEIGSMASSAAPPTKATYVANGRSMSRLRPTTYAA